MSSKRQRRGAFTRAAQRIDLAVPCTDWFHALMGFPEEAGGPEGYLRTQARLGMKQDPPRICSQHAEHRIGAFHTPQLSEVRAEALAELQRRPGVLRGRMSLDHALGDVSVLIGEHPHAVFQVASQFNCLEFPGPDVTPEDGVTGYVTDRTQGPACSIACGGATVYRNYLAPVDVRDEAGKVTGTQVGQTANAQIDNLRGVCDLVGNRPRGKFYTVRGGVHRGQRPGACRAQRGARGPGSRRGQGGTQGGSAS